ncbi:MAG: rhamnulokinase [Clostridiales bacterium]|nr:rhamnulokinase [Clostridiales bacterium]
MKKPVYVAVDIGATGIKMAAASFDEEKIKIEEVFSSDNGPCIVDGQEKADIRYMLETIHKGLDQFSIKYRCVSLGIDTYGNGYGILDDAGQLIELPHHYRDRRIDNILEAVHRHFTDWQLYEKTGNYPIKTRSLFHLYEDVLENSDCIQRGRDYLPLSSLLEYLITGEKGTEKTIASVLYMLDRDGENWNFDVLKELGIPAALFGALEEPGTFAGHVTESFADGSEWAGIPVIRVAGHDTESALAAVPGLDETKAFVSMGTSFILGARVPKPVITKESFRERFKNMRGVFGTCSLCKDVPGFWILERCMEKWRAQDSDLDYEKVCNSVQKVTDNFTFIDISDDRFRVSESDIIKTIQEYCSNTGQKPVYGMEATARCLFESYAAYICWSVERLSSLTGISYREIHTMNGGVRNKVLLQMIADAAGIPVVAASSLSSACGNILMQIYGEGKLSSGEEFEKTAYASVLPVRYESNHSPGWDERLRYIKEKGLFKEDH